MLHAPDGSPKSGQRFPQPQELSSPSLWSIKISFQIKWESTIASQVSNQMKVNESKPSSIQMKISESQPSSNHWLIDWLIDWNAAFRNPVTGVSHENGIRNVNLSTGFLINSFLTHVRGYLFRSIPACSPYMVSIVVLTLSSLSTCWNELMEIHRKSKGSTGNPTSNQLVNQSINDRLVDFHLIWTSPGFVDFHLIWTWLGFVDFHLIWTSLGLN